MCFALAGGLGLFLFSLVLHVVVWRVRSPKTYRTWLPLLGIIVGPIAGAAAWAIAPTALDAAAILLLHGSLAAVYVIGYTLVSAVSPSLELLKVVDRSEGGLPIESLQLPFVAGTLIGDRIDTLASARLVRQRGTWLEIGPRGVWLTRIVLLYRHAIGLPDGGGG